MPPLRLVPLVGLLLSCTAQDTRPSRPAPDHSALDRILAATVRAGSVDYLRIREEFRGELRGYLDRMARVDPVHLSRDEQLAYYLNLYNATMIEAVVARLNAGYSPADSDHVVFREGIVRLRGGRVSLDHLENQIIRRRFDEPRIHVALVCAARSCPPLLPRAYRAADLDEVLEANMRRFLGDGTRNRVDVEGRALRLSRIFDWYADDFGGRGGLRQYVQRYLEADVSDFEVEFLDYSWELNMQPPGAGWASLKARVPGLPKGSYVRVLQRRGPAIRVRDENGRELDLAREALELHGD